MEFRISTFVSSLAPDESVKVIVYSLGGYIMTCAKVIKDWPFQIPLDYDYPIWVDKALRGSYQYALLR